MDHLKDSLWPKPPHPLAGLSLSIDSLSPDPCSSGLNFGGAGILNLLSIAYASRPRLRTRLTLGGRTFPRKPWVYGDQGFHLVYRYSCLHTHFSELHLRLPFGFNAQRTLPYHYSKSRFGTIQSFGITLIANHFRREITR